MAPAGLDRALAWKFRFEAVGLNPRKAWRAALSKQMRDALVFSRIEHLPSELRTNLGWVIDVGANIGQWMSGLMAITQVNRIEVFEPNPEAFEILKSRFGNCRNVHLHNLAVGDRAGTVDLNVTRSSDLSSLLTPGNTLTEQYGVDLAEVVKQERVSVTTLDEIIPEDVYIDLIKVDVQGFEHSVLLGARETLKRTRALLIEANFVSHYEKDGTFGSLHEQLTNDLGFSFWDISPPYRGIEKQALWTDAVFLNRSLQ